MTPEQALKLLDQAGAAANGNRTDHYNIQEAVRILAEVIRPKPDPVSMSEPPAAP